MRQVRILSALTGLGSVLALTSACAIVPDGGRITSASIAERGGQQDVFVQLIPPAPQPGWAPDQIVSGFLLASASFVGNHAVAREYLTRSAARSWHPGSSVAEFADTPTATTTAIQPDVWTFEVGGSELGTISEDGQYRAVEQGGSDTWNLTVIRVGGQWRIKNPPDQLLLSKSDVNRTFRSRDLYFFDPSMSVLVPDPVYIPAEATSSDLVTHLAAALRQGPQGWLQGGARTAFPIGTRVLNTSVNSSTAIVNLGGSAAAAGSQQRSQMAAQLLQTLVSAPAFPSPSVQAVVFEIDGKPVQASCASGHPLVLQLSTCAGPVPPTGSHVYYLDGKGRVASLAGSRSDIPVPGPAGTGQLPFDRISVSPDQANLAGAVGGALYTGRLGGSLSRRLVATSITCLSWDRASGLWVVGRVGRQTRLWRLGARPVAVRPPAGIGPVTALRVAPDGVRVAMISDTGARSRLWLAAISRNGDQVSIGQPVPIGTDISNFSDLSWYDTSDLIALTQPPSGSALYEVPVDGGQSRDIVTESGTIGIAASSAASGTGLVAVRSSDGALMQLPDPSGSIWEPVSMGRSPVYAG